MSGAITVIEAGDLSMLPALIDAAVADVQAHAGGMVQAAVRVGQLLLQAKAQQQHGDWEAWLTTKCTIAPRTARAYMRLATKLPELPAPDRQRVADLPLREALTAISTSPTAPAKLPSSFYPRRDRRERVSAVLSKSAAALRAMTRNIGDNLVKRTEIERTRAKLQAALAALDELQAEDDAVEVPK